MTYDTDSTKTARLSRVEYMRKDILLAIFVGMSLGLMITFGIYQNRENSQNKQNRSSDSVVNKQTDSSAEQEDSLLSISTPADNLLTQDATLMVSGTTNPNNFVIIFVNAKEEITHSDQAGNFSKGIILEEGANLLEIYSLDEDNQFTKKIKSVIYDPNDLFAEPSSESPASNSAVTQG